MIEPRDTIQRMKPYVPPLEHRIDKHRFDFNENILGCSPRVIEALRDLDPAMLSTYPEYGPYYAKISQLMDISPEQLILANGTDEAINLIMQTYLEAGDEVILPEPTFSMYRFYAQRIGLQIRSVMYNDDLSFPTSRLLAAISDSTKLVILVNPNNPTGGPISQSDIEEIIKSAPNALVLVDEAYYEFAGQTSLDFITKYTNVVVLRTGSKSLGLAGLRIGMAISNVEIVSVLKKASSPYNVSALAAYLAVIALEDSDYSHDYVKQVVSSRRSVIKQLESWGYKVYPSVANFVLVRFGLFNNYINRYLKSRDILVRDRSSYPLLEGCTRITLGSQADTQLLLDSISEARKQPLLIFDMDGVLVDVSQSYRRAIALTVEQITGQQINPEEIQDLKNEGGYNNDWILSQELCRRRGKVVDLDRVTAIFQEHYLGSAEKTGLIDDEQWLLPHDVLDRLSRKYPMYIFTGRPRSEAIHALEVAGTDTYFDGLIAMEDTPAGQSKPDPWGIEQIKSLFDASQTYYFGDTVDDITAAIAAGAIAVGVIDSDTDQEGAKVIQDAGASKIIRIHEIEELL